MPATHTTTETTALARPRSWVLTTFAGWAAGFVLAVILIIATDSIGIPGKASLGLGMALGLGLAQRRAARACLGVERGWAWSYVAGLTVPMLAYDAARLIRPALDVHIAVFVVLGGALTGVLQWRLLRNRLPRARWWIPAMTLAWAIAGATVGVNDRYLPRVPGILGAALYIGVILLGGVVIGMTQRALLYGYRGQQP
jgi:hypothetical protein